MNAFSEITGVSNLAKATTVFCALARPFQLCSSQAKCRKKFRPQWHLFDTGAVH